jgi:hypothetical protein
LANGTGQPLRQLLAANWPYAKIEEIMEAKITEKENARMTEETPRAL